MSPCHDLGVGWGPPNSAPHCRFKKEKNLIQRTSGKNILTWRHLGDQTCFPRALWDEPWMNHALWSLFPYCTSESTASSGPREMLFGQSPHGASPVGVRLQSTEMTDSCVHPLSYCELLEAGTYASSSLSWSLGFSECLRLSTSVSNSHDCFSKYPPLHCYVPSWSVGPCPVITRISENIFTPSELES